MSQVSSKAQVLKLYREKVTLGDGERGNSDYFFLLRMRESGVRLLGSDIV